MNAIKSIRVLTKQVCLARRCLSQAAPAVATQASDYPEKIQKIVSDISQLTLIEVAELNKLLKLTLNISDVPVMAYGGGAAPAKAEEDAEEVPVAKVQTAFTLKIVSFDEGKKVALIKQVKTLLEGMNLVQAKKFVESTPAVVKADISKDEAEKLKEALTAAGAQCEIS